MTPQEAAEQYANKEYGEGCKSLPEARAIWDNGVTDFLAGAKWQSEQDNQALSSALKEIAELTSWKNEMLQLWNKLDAYIETRKDIRLGESKVDFAIKIMKERDDLHAKVNEMKDQLKQHLPEECVQRYAEVKFCSIRNGDGWQCKECAI